MDVTAKQTGSNLAEECNKAIYSLLIYSTYTIYRIYIIREDDGKRWT